MQREIIVVSSEIHFKTHKLCEQNVQFLNVIPGLYSAGHRGIGYPNWTFVDFLSL